jgi:uncharacterized protein GlcG (DUF336 family)
MSRTNLSLSLADAKQIIDAGERKASEIKRLYSFAVVDAGGNLMAYLRMDGALIASIDIAINKAWTACAVGMSTEDLGRIAQEGKPGFGINTTNHSRIVIFGGGIPVPQGGEIIGAIGASGGTVDEDLLVARAALAAL